jgi:hypothetical protein
MRFVKDIGLLQQFRAFIASWGDGFFFRAAARKKKPAGLLVRPAVF